MDKVKELLARESWLRPSEALLDQFLAPAESISLKKNEVLIMSGKYDPNIYIVKEGIIRYSYMHGVKETTFIFALPGSMIISMHCFYAHQPAFYQVDACCPSIVLRITKSHFDHLVESSHEFARWALSYEQGQLYYLEKKDTVINGDARERYESLLRQRPDILEKVALKHIASYLGITPQYFSRLKQQIR